MAEQVKKRPPAAKTDSPKPPTKAVLLRYLAAAKEVGADEVLVASDGSTRFILKGPDGEPSALDAWKARREAR